jgi:hypothetical protein
MRHIVICVLPHPIIFFSHYLVNGTILEEKVIAHKMCVVEFPATFVWNISCSKKNCARYDRKSALVCGKYPFFLSHETWIFSTVFQKYSNIKFHKNPSSGSRVVTCGWTDRHDEANSLFFLTFVSSPKDSTFCPQIALRSFSHNKYRLLPHTALTDFFITKTESVYCAVRTDCLKVVHVTLNLQSVNLTLIFLTWRIWWTPNNASKWQMGFN